MDKALLIVDGSSPEDVKLELPDGRDLLELIPVNAIDCHLEANSEGELLVSLGYPLVHLEGRPRLTEEDLRNLAAAHGFDLVPADSERETS